MKIFSSHRRKLSPSRRFGGLEFRRKIRDAQSYKRLASLDRKKIPWKALRNLGIMLLAVIVYYLTISSRFVISDIKVSGNQQVSTEQILNTMSEAGSSRLFFVKKNNFFLLTQGRANALLAEKLPNIKEITWYNRIWPDKVEFTVVERNPGFTIKSSDKYFLVDDEGIVVSAQASPNGLLVAEDQIVEDFGLREPLANTKLAPFIQSMASQWPSKISTKVSKVKFRGKASPDVQFETVEGWNVFFSTDRSVVSALNNLTLILNKQVGGNRSKLAYIDLRANKWAYLCYTAQPCVQQPQPEENTDEKKQ